MVASLQPLHKVNGVGRERPAPKTKNQTQPNMNNDKYIALTNYDCIQILACSQALEMADKHKMYLAHPKSIRATASHWLNKVNAPHSPKAKWATLSIIFNTTFEVVLNKMKEKEGAK